MEVIGPVHICSVDDDIIDYLTSKKWCERANLITGIKCHKYPKSKQFMLFAESDNDSDDSDNDSNDIYGFLLYEIDKKECILHLLCTSPNVRGAGKLLMQKLIDIADGTNIILQSSPTAVSFYEKFGFKPYEKGLMVLDLTN